MKENKINLRMYSKKEFDKHTLLIISSICLYGFFEKCVVGWINYLNLIPLFIAVYLISAPYTILVIDKVKK